MFGTPQGPHGKSLVIPIVGDHHFRTLLVHQSSQTIFWHDPYGRGQINLSIKQWLGRGFRGWEMINISDALQQNGRIYGLTCVFIAERFFEWSHGMYGQRSYAEVIGEYSRLLSGSALGCKVEIASSPQS